MNYIRLQVAIGGLICFSMFIFSNLMDIVRGSGYVFLFLSGFLALITISLRKKICIPARISKSEFLLLTFLVYFLIKLVLDLQDLDAIKGLTIGTTGGVIFSLLLGVIVSIFVIEISRFMETSSRHTKIAQLHVLAYFCVILGLQFLAFNEHYSNVRTDLFMVEEYDIYYQRPADLQLIQFLVVSSLMVLMWHQANIRNWKGNILLYIACFFLYLGITIEKMVFAQLVGSNLGFIAVGGYAVSVIVFLLSVTFLKKYGGRIKVKLSSLVYGPLAVRIFSVSIILLILFSIVMIQIFAFFGIDPDTFRFSGFGEGGLFNVTSRLEIFRNNFLIHFLHSPVFGHGKVELYTTGDGTYVHSLLSIITHLGVVGFLIFAVFIIELYSRYKRFYVFSADGVLKLFKLVTLSIVLLYGLIATFYVWMPLWFTIGFQLSDDKYSERASI